MQTSTSATIDPICGMAVEPATALHAQRDGRTFYFCGDRCRQKFLSGSPSPGEPKKSGGCCCS